MKDGPDVTVIGTGALGSGLARALQERGMKVKSLYNRTPDKANTLARDLGVKTSGRFPDTISRLGRLVFLPVPDSYISDCAHRLATLSDDYSGYIIVHCSGTLTSDALDPVRKKGAMVAAFNPFQTFTRLSQTSDFRHIYFGAEGDAKAVELLEKVARKFESTILPVSAASKPYLHAAAVVASNYLLALMETAGDIAKLGQVDAYESRRALLPLVQKSLENAGAEDLASVLSGPIARGDVSTVRSHLQLLEQNSGLLMLYKQLGRKTLDMARRTGRLEAKQLEALTDLLEENDNH